MNTPLLRALLILVATCLTDPTFGASLRYQDVPLTYMQQPRLPVPAGASTFAVQGAEALGLDPTEIVISGYTRIAADSDGDGPLQIQLSGAKPTRGKPTHSSFETTVFYSVENKASPPAYELMVYWATIPFTMPAKLDIAGAGPDSTYNVGMEFTASVGPKPDKTSAGVFQMAAGPWTLMQSEPCSSPEAVVTRVKWIVEQMCADVRTVGGSPVLQTDKGQSRLQAKLDAFDEAQVGTRLRQAVIKEINRILERDLARGERTVNIALAVVKGETAFEEAEKKIRGNSADRFTSAANDLAPYVDDSRKKPRMRAAACYNLAFCRLGAGDLEAAAREVARSRSINASERDGMLGSSGKQLGAQLDALDGLVKDLQMRQEASAIAATAPGAAPAETPAPAPREAPGTSPPHEAAAATMDAPLAPGATTTSPAAPEMSDAEFMAAYPGLAQAAVQRGDHAEVQRLAARMAEVMMHMRSPKK